MKKNVYDEDLTRVIAVRLPPRLIVIANRLGNGNLSAGIRKALERQSISHGKKRK